ncbi:MAG: P22 phage major capsid protein family protein [Bryobacteraceae bacterium]|nr:P22 phage major capsid protein family protein [Bryobacteraceae bacterium]
MSTLTSENLASAIVKLVAVDALPALMGNLVMGNLVNRDFEPSLAQAGDTINVPIPPTLSANNLAEGGMVVQQNVSLGNAQIVLDTHAEATFQIPDVSKVLAVPDLLRLYMQPAVIALAERIETDLLLLAQQFTSNNSVGTPGTALNEATIDSAETALFNARVPASASKYLVVDGNAYSNLRQINRFSEYQTAGEAGLRAIVDGSVGKIKDFYVFRSQFIRKAGTPTVTTSNLAFTKDAIGLVTRRLPQPLFGTGAIAEYAEMGNFGVRVLMSYAPNTLAQQFTVDILYGCAIVRNAFGVHVRS